MWKKNGYPTDEKERDVWEMFVKDVHAECNLT
jgi:hypothetical protein